MSNDEIKQYYLEQWVKDINSRAKKMKIVGVVNIHELHQLIKDCDGYCEWCHASLLDGFEIDHIQALINGGDNVITNLAVTCTNCNRRKGSKPHVQWAQEILMSTGLRTVLVQRILDDFEIDGLVQKSLFDE
ncbi:hypothetical protein MASR2M15_21800 [Anaerolineales bacterium]